MRIFLEGEGIGRVEVELLDKELSKRLLDVLPLEVVPDFWGEEIYFEVPLEDIKGEAPTRVVEEGDVAIWLENPSLCIFFGKTPISTGDEILAYSEVEVIGKVVGDPKIFKSLKKGAPIKVLKE